MRPHAARATSQSIQLTTASGALRFRGMAILFTYLHTHSTRPFHPLGISPTQAAVEERPSSLQHHVQALGRTIGWWLLLRGAVGRGLRPLATAGWPRPSPPDRGASRGFANPRRSSHEKGGAAHGHVEKAHRESQSVRIVSKSDSDRGAAGKYGLGPSPSSEIIRASSETRPTSLAFAW